MNFGTSGDYTGEFYIGAGIGAASASRKRQPALTILKQPRVLGSARSPDSVSLCSKSNAWISATTVVCGTGPTTTGIDMRFHVGINKVVGTGAPSFSYDSPVLTVLSPTNGPTTGGASITVKGYNFGPSKPYMPHQGQMGDSLDMLPCSTVFWLNNNIVVCSSSHGKGTSASIAIGPTPSTYSGTLMGAFSFDAPVVTFLALDNAPTVGGSLITITGMNMGTELSETNQVDISVAGNECSSSAFISNTPFSSVKWIF
jgi:hypothetical protein